MKSSLEQFETAFRSTPKNAKRHFLSLANYVQALFDSGRVIEANYFLKRMEALKPLHKRTIHIGYDLAIALFDKNSVFHYDDLLVKSKPTIQELFIKRIKFYHSINNHQKAVTLCVILLKKSLDREQLGPVIETFLSSGSFELAKELEIYKTRKHIEYGKQISRKIKETVLKELLISLIGAANAKHANS